MNNNCPGCDAVYNVAAKDVGRRLKCKKCGMALEVTAAGLEEDTGGAPRPAPPPGPAPAAAVVEDEEDDAPVVKKGKGSKFGRTPGVNPLAALAGIGGIPTILFGFGAFLVIVFLFMPLIAVAAESRADGAGDQLRHELKVEKRKKLPKGTYSEVELKGEERTKYDEEVKKLVEKYQPKIIEAEDSEEDAKISRKRSLWVDRYGMMFGFLFLMFGSLGYLLNPDSGIRRIVGTITLLAQLIIIFLVFGAGGCVGTVGDSIKGLGGLK